MAISGTTGLKSRDAEMDWFVLRLHSMLPISSRNIAYFLIGNLCKILMYNPMAPKSDGRCKTYVLPMHHITIKIISNTHKKGSAYQGTLPSYLYLAPPKCFS
jgi:hypothetical protein